MKRFVTYLMITILALLTLIPFVYMAMTSFKDNAGNANGLFVPYENDRTIAITPSAVDTTTGTIKVTDSVRTGEQLVYHGGGKPIDGLTDGQTYYAVVLPDGSLKLADSRDHAMAAGATIDAAGRDPKAQAAAIAAVPAAHIASTGGASVQTFESPFHVLWDSFTLGNYIELFTDNPNIKYQIANSFFFASVSSLLATLFCAMGGYALAMFKFKGRNLMTSIVLAALIIPATMLIAPAYQLIFHFGLLDTLSGLILPAIGPAFLVFLFRQAMISGLPGELLEAGRIDGCGEIRMFFTIALPLVRPMVSASLLITFIASWNNFINPQVILQSPRNFTLSVAVAQLQDIYSVKYGTLMAGTLISVLPVMLLFILLQKEFIAGLTAGAVKG